MKTLFNHKRKLALLAFLVSWISQSLAHAATGTWSSTGSMADVRHAHTATLLQNGKVLVAGRYGGVSISAELYDSATGTWATTGEMFKTSYGHTATLLQNGKVLVTGGWGDTGNLSRAELYDPEAGTWAATGEMGAPRSSHTATLLSNGKVLVAGGEGSGYPMRAELYDPGTGTWTPTGDMKLGRTYGHTATLLPNGKVLVVGGWGGTGNYYLLNAELYDPGTGLWTETRGMHYHREHHTATLLPNGKLMVAGGRGYNGGILQIAEVYDIATEEWMITGSMETGRYVHTATLLPSGEVLIAGGIDRSLNCLSSSELYNPVSGTWRTTGVMSTVRYGHTADLLPNGKVLVAGGYSSYYLSSAELYVPGPFTLTLLAMEHGEIAGNASPYPLGATATLTPIASPGYVFTEWTGDFSEAANPLTILMDSDKSLGAVFGPDPSDADGDGLSAYQEIVTYGCDPSKNDTDGDGFLDGYEVLTGKSPLDDQSKPALVAEARTAIEFTFPSALGKTYRIEDSLDLTTWETVESGIAGNGGVIQRFYSTRNVPKRYFRVEEDPQ